jgi:hypothetical protein
MLRRVALVRTDVSEEHVGCNSSVLQLLVTACVPTSLIVLILMMEAKLSSETSVLTRATMPDIPEDGSLLELREYFSTNVCVCSFEFLEQNCVCSSNFRNPCYMTSLLIRSDYQSLATLPQPCTSCGSA